MHGPAQRLIRKHGATYTVRNATGGAGGRDTPDYADDGTEIVGVLEQRGMARTVTDSNGEDVEADREIRAVIDASVTIQPAGTADGYPTVLVHPNGQAFRVLDRFPEDSGVDVLAVVTN